MEGPAGSPALPSDFHRKDEAAGRGDTTMPANRTNLLQVQLTEAEKRHIKTLAVSQGLTLRQATLHAFQTWESQLRRPTPAANPPRDMRARSGWAAAGQPKRSARRAEPAPERGSGFLGFRRRSDPQPGRHVASLAPRSGTVGLVEMCGGTESTREKPVRFGWSAELTRRWLRSCRASPTATRFWKLPRSSRSLCNS